jgi:hypothetical protein
MEDRVTPGLYLEMTDDPLDEYVAGRVADLLAHPGVSRATWWRNVNRHRVDLPRRIPEFDHLAVYEVDDRFGAPSTPDGVRGHLFHHYRRPGQGRLTGRPTLGLSLVLISPSEPHRAQELRDWGDFVHIRHIAEVAVPGYTMITPYENVTGQDPRYLHFYEMDTDEPEAAFGLMTPLVERLLNADRTRSVARDQTVGVPPGDSFRRWASHDALRIDYVNSFVRMGELA